ncbi:MAG: sel1 repeat family protein, partial [Gammaproteobacteria bacterium]
MEKIWKKLRLKWKMRFECLWWWFTLPGGFLAAIVLMIAAAIDVQPWSLWLGVAGGVAMAPYALSMGFLLLMLLLRAVLAPLEFGGRIWRKWWSLSGHGKVVSVASAIAVVATTYSVVVTQQYQRVVEIGHLRILAEQGDAKAQYDLADALSYLRDGDGLTSDDDEWTRWLRKSAEQGLAEAQYDLSRRYRMGFGVAKDISEALRWLRVAAQQKGEWAHRAQYKLGFAYWQDYEFDHTSEYWHDIWFGYDSAEDKIAQDKHEAVRLWRTAAEQGYAAAQFALGWAYWTSDAPADMRDFRESYIWHSIAVANGSKNAKRDLRELKKWNKQRNGVFAALF